MNTIKPTDIEDFKRMLKRKGLKTTPQRLCVHTAMLELGHASAEMVCERIAKAGGHKVTEASVYNILTHFANLGIYSFRMSSNNKMYFDVNTFPHIHLYDRQNNVYRDILDSELMAAIYDRLSHKKFKGFAVENIDIQIVVSPTKKRTLPSANKKTSNS